MANAANLKLGNCTVTFNGVDLGHTRGGVELVYEPMYADVMADAYGDSKVDSYLKGEKLTVKVPLAEKTVANMKVAMPNGTFAGAANARLLVGQKAGQKMSNYAAQLVLHPQNEGTRVNDVVIHKAVVLSAVTLAHSNDEQTVVEVTFEALIDESKSQGNYLGLFGDSTA